MLPNKNPLALIILAILITLGLIDAWAGRQSYVAGDTVSYMDMARNVAGGNLQHAVNGHWSPLYPTILAIFIWPFQSNSLLEFSMVRGVNFLIFVTTIALFQMFLSRLLDHYYGRVGTTPESLPRRYSASIASALDFTSAPSLNPIPSAIAE